MFVDEEVIREVESLGFWDSRDRKEEEKASILVSFVVVVVLEHSISIRMDDERKKGPKRRWSERRRRSLESTRASTISQNPGTMNPSITGR